MKSIENNLKQYLRVEKMTLSWKCEKNAFWWPIKTPYIKHIYCRMHLIVSMHHLWQLRKKMTFHQNPGPSGDDNDGQMMLGDLGEPKASRHLSYRWGKTPEKTSTRKTEPTGDRTRPARWEATMLPLDHSGGRGLLGI